MRYSAHRDETLVEVVSLSHSLSFLICNHPISKKSDEGFVCLFCFFFFFFLVVVVVVSLSLSLSLGERTTAIHPHRRHGARLTAG